MGETEFIWAVKNGDLDAVKQAIEENGLNVNGAYQGRSPLHLAADYGHVQVLEYLISKGANVEAQDKHGMKPLLAAVLEGHVDCVRTLLEKGASSDGKTPSGESYIDVAEDETIRSLLKTR